MVVEIIEGGTILKVVREGLSDEIIFAQRPLPQIRKQAVSLSGGKEVPPGRENSTYKDLQAGVWLVGEHTMEAFQIIQGTFQLTASTSPALAMDLTVSSIPQPIDHCTFSSLHSCVLIFFFIQPRVFIILSVQFKTIKYVHIVVQSVTRTLFILQN